MLQPVEHRPTWNPRAGQRPELGPSPCIHPTAIVRESRVGAWTEIGAFTTLLESTLDDYSYVAAGNSQIWCAAIGKFTSIAAAVRINPPNHPMERVTQHHCTYRRRQYGFDTQDDETVFARRRRQKVIIGHDVWIGHGAVILPGIAIGTGAVVGAGAVVSRSVAPYAIVAGVPARPLRRRFSDEIVASLLDIAWWNWDRATLGRRFQDLMDIERFVARYGRGAH
jgi:phosphonate metabolism protein (transferase hexapeptide repeat family)